ncbi:MAG TPA: FAD-binding oxidoreductase, partial [Candidatus Paceibacterota bacterium]
WAIASKFIFAYRRRHIFNPAAFGVALSSFTIGASATWWVGGSLIMLPFVFVLGVLVIRKVRRLDLMAGFFAALCVSIFIASHTGAAALSTIEQNLMYTPAFFFAFAMLSEPLTTPPTRARRIVYGAIVGVLSAPATNIAGFFFTPELALLAGNIVSFFISAKERFMFVLVERIRLARGVYEFVFATDRRRALAFNAGQYIECTLDHSRIDQRGNRRYFTISSSPEDEHVRLGVKFYDAPSSFKRALFQLQPGGVLSASHVAGDFTLPRDTKRKLAFIAGGVGVTPFASMVRDLTDRQESRDTIVLYSAKGADEIAYRDVFSSAEPFGVKTIYVFSEGALQERVETRRGSIDRAMIEKEIPDWHERTFYLSGPHGMVSAVNEILREMGVPMRQIKKDFFPGLM